MSSATPQGTTRSSLPPRTMLDVEPMQEMLSCEMLRYYLTRPDLERRLLHPDAIDSALFLSSANLLPSPGGPVYAAPTYVVEAIDWLVVPLLVVEHRWLVCTPLVAPTTIATATTTRPFAPRTSKSSSVQEHAQASSNLHSNFSEKVAHATTGRDVLLNPERIRRAHARGPSLRRLGVIGAHANDALHKIRLMVQGQSSTVDETLSTYRPPLAKMSSAKVVLARAVFDLQVPTSQAVHTYLISIAEGGFCLIGAHVFEADPRTRPNLAAHFLYAGLPEMTLPTDTSPSFARVEISEVCEELVKTCYATDISACDRRQSCNIKSNFGDYERQQQRLLFSPSSIEANDKPLRRSKLEHDAKREAIMIWPRDQRRRDGNSGLKRPPTAGIFSSLAAITQFLEVNGSGQYTAHHVMCLNVPHVGNVTVNDIAGRRISTWTSASRAPSVGLKTRLLYEYGFTKENPAMDLHALGAFDHGFGNSVNAMRSSKRQKRVRRSRICYRPGFDNDENYYFPGEDDAKVPLDEDDDVNEIEDKSSREASDSDEAGSSGEFRGLCCERRKPVQPHELKAYVSKHRGSTFAGNDDGAAPGSSSCMLECHVCQVEVEGMDALECHYGKSHSELQLVKCQMCPMSFSNRSNRRRHEKSVHRGVRPYICEYPGCGKAFSQRSDLVRHGSRHVPGRARKSTMAAGNLEPLDDGADS